MTSVYTRSSMMKSEESPCCNAMRGDIEGGARGGDRCFKTLKMMKG